MTNQLPKQQQDQCKTRPRSNETAAEQAKTEALVRELHDGAENKAQGESGPKRRRNLVYANKFEIALPQHNSNNSASKNTLEVTSWRLNEFEYSKGTLPSLARGLFTYQDLNPSSRNHIGTNGSNQNPISPESAAATDGVSPQPHNHILIRGYDKFFNIGEVTQTKLENLEAETMGPYEVTLKENGCIIFMAGLPPHLVGGKGGCVVSSKHNLGTIEQQLQKFGEGQQGDSIDSEGLHPVKGREWLEKNLAAKGKTVQEFGLWLWNNNLTAVAELCDDSFEEHILEYTGERAGLYLHGLNRNTAEFQTLSSEQVQQAAEDWGFQRVDYITCNSFKEVMAFAEKIRNAGEYDNRAVEGFVVRAQRRNNGQVQFFKIKYDEPYLMYREWREVTKHIWSVESKREVMEQKQKASAELRAKMIAEGRAQSKNTKTGAKTNPTVAAATPVQAPEATAMPRRMKYPLTRPYVDFVRDLMKTQPELFTGYNKNHGIIAVRDMFIKHWESKSTQDQEALLTVTSTTSSSSSKVAQEDFQRTVIIPIATIGCGKTTVSVSLSKLFGWTHVSSDDFQHIRKNPGQRFIREIVNQLRTHTVVIADRNNHEYLHRERLMNAVLEEFPKTRFVALYWSHDDLPQSSIHALEVERVKGRGSNHQNLTPEYCPEFEYVISSFLKSFNPLNPMVAPDSKFSNVVESKFGEESLLFVQRIVKEFAIPTLGAGGLGNHSIPSDEEIVEAVRFAREDWKPARVESGEAEKYHKEKQLQATRQASKGNLLTSDDNKTTVNSGGSGASTPRARKIREPRYYGVSLEASSVLHFLEEQFEQRDLPIEKSSGHITGPKDAHWLQFQRQLQAWKGSHRIGLYQHVTLVHSSARKHPYPEKAKRAENLWQKYTQEIAGGPSQSSSSSASLPSSPLETFSATLAQALPTIEGSVAAPVSTNEAFRPVTRRKDRRGGKSASNVPTTTADSAAGSSSSSAIAAVAASLAAEGEADDGLSDLHSTVTVDYLVWTERIAILRVSNARRTRSGNAYETTQDMLHITIGTVDDQVKPYESNDVLREWNKRMKHHTSEKTPAGPEIFSIQLEKPKVFTGHLKGMMF